MPYKLPKAVRRQAGFALTDNNISLEKYLSASFLITATLKRIHQALPRKYLL